MDLKRVGLLAAAVVTVGAGVAGLSAAHRLTSAGVTTAVLEAADRVGGRMSTEKVDGFRLDRIGQLLFTSYPELTHGPGLDALVLRSFAPGVLLHSARFPVVSPAGSVLDMSKPGHPLVARLIDGGYFDNSGVVTALELIDYGTIEERRAEAKARGKLLGVGIGSTLDSGTNNFGQSQLLNPELQFSGNNEVATVKLDIFGEIVVTLGTTPQGQGH